MSDISIDYGGPNQSTAVDTSGQAFPAYRGFDAKPPHVPGMSLLDWFAGMAMAGYNANPVFSHANVDDIAGDSFAQADAMINERAKRLAPE